MKYKLGRLHSRVCLVYRSHNWQTLLLHDGSCRYTQRFLNIFTTIFDFLTCKIIFYTDWNNLCDSWHDSNGIKNVFVLSCLTTVQCFCKTRSHGTHWKGQDSPLSSLSTLNNVICKVTCKWMYYINVMEWKYRVAVNGKYIKTVRQYTT